MMEANVFFAVLFSLHVHQKDLSQFLALRFG